MTDEQTNIENQEEQTTREDVKEEKTLLQEAESQASRLEAANAKTEELLQRQEKIAMQNMLGGRSEAGMQPAPVVPETDEEYTARFESGQVDLLK